MARSLLTILSLLFLSSCTTGLHVTNYAGPDAGVLVTSLGAKTGTVYNGYNLFYRKKNHAPDGDGMIWWGQASILEGHKLDIDTGSETGIVDVRRLPPGEYEIFNFRVFYNGGNVQKHFSSKTDFSIPFSIRPGRATYIGEFIAVGVQGENIFGFSIPDGAYFTVSNRGERDIAIARQKYPGLGRCRAPSLIPSWLAIPSSGQARLKRVDNIVAGSPQG
jgi:hypothetical protein